MKKSEILEWIEKDLVEAMGDKEEYTGAHELEVIETGLRNFRNSVSNTIIDGEPVRNYISIWWHVDDVKYQAGWDADTQEWSEDSEYDRTKMHDVLHMLKSDHDCTFGINWNVIDCTLDNHRDAVAWRTKREEEII